MYLWWNLRILYLLACQVRVTVADSGVCCCVCATSVGRYVGPLFVDSFWKGDIHHTRNCPPLQLWRSYALSGKGTYIILETVHHYSFGVRMLFLERGHTSYYKLSTITALAFECSLWKGDIHHIRNCHQ